MISVNDELPTGWVVGVDNAEFFLARCYICPTGAERNLDGVLRRRVPARDHPLDEASLLWRKMMIDLKDVIFKAFLKQSKDQLVSVYKARQDLSKDCNRWGGCWTDVPAGISYQDIEDLVSKNRAM